MILRFISTKICKNLNSNLIKRSLITLNLQTSNVRKFCTNSDKLTQELRSRIMALGPMTIADYMKEVLTHPRYGYYMTKDVFGEKGDFVTSPETGQMLGELITVWFLNELEKIGYPSPLQIIELGPGRGSLSQDILRVFQHFRKYSKSTFSLHLIEISEYLSKIQAQTLNVTLNQTEDTKELYYKSGVTADGTPVYWYQKINDVPKQFSIVIAHEFFDALPIHKLKRTNDGWREVLVDLDPNTQKFVFVLSRNPTPVSQLFVRPDETRNEIEVCPQALVLIEHLATRLEEYGGIGLVADYGHKGEKTDTFRAFKKHCHHHPLVDPGTADLTADVDFSQLISMATKDNKLICFGPITQHDFLKAMGIDVRLKILMERADEKEKKILQESYDMMVDANKMGDRFKFISLFPAVLKDHLKKFPVTAFS